MVTEWKVGRVVTQADPNMRAHERSRMVLERGLLLTTLGNQAEQGPAASAPVLAAYADLHEAAGHACLPEDFATTVKKDIAEEAQFRARHDFIAHRKILRHTGIASSIEPLLLMFSKPGDAMNQAGARGDVLAILRAVKALDVRVTHPAVNGTNSSNLSVLRHCASEEGHAALKRDERKRKKYRDNGFRE